MAKAQTITLTTVETGPFANAKAGEAYAEELGRTFDAMFADYIGFQRRTVATVKGFERAAEVFKVQPGTTQYVRLRNTRCDGAIQTLADMGTEMDGITKLIRDMPISGPKSLLAKAKALQFDCCLYPMEGPLDDWDWSEECLHTFIDQLSIYATGRAL